MVVRVACLSAIDSFSFLHFYWVGSCWTICPIALFVPFFPSLDLFILSLSSFLSYNHTDHAQLQILTPIEIVSFCLLSFLSHSRTHIYRIHASRKICQKYRARKGGEGRKFRNNLHLRTGLIISPLKLTSLILSFTSLVFTIHICGPPGRQGGRLSLYNFFTFLSISSFLAHSLLFSQYVSFCTLSLVIIYRSFSHSLTLAYPFALHRFLFLSFSQLGSVCAERLLPVAPNSQFA